MFSRCIRGGLLFPVPSGHQVSAMLSLPVPLLLITAALVLPWGKLTSLLSPALLVVSCEKLHAILCYVIRIGNVALKHSRRTRIRRFVSDGGFVKPLVSVATEVLTFA